MKKFLWNMGTGLVVAVLVFLCRGGLRAQTAGDALRILSDGFFASSALLLFSGGMRWLKNTGALDGLGYAFQMIRRQSAGSFAGYRETRRSKAKSPVGVLTAGLAYFGIALYFCGAYYRAA